MTSARPGPLPNSAGGLGKAIAGDDDFSAADRQRFDQHLAAETRRLQAVFDNGQLAAGSRSLGYEMEVCLVDADGRPADANAAFIERLGQPEVVPELARCNIEFNGAPLGLAGDGLAPLLLHRGRCSSCPGAGCYSNTPQTHLKWGAAAAPLAKPARGPAPNGGR